MAEGRGRERERERERKQGFGAMGLSAFYESATKVSEEEKISLLKHVYDSGVTLFNSANFYGPLHHDGYGHNLRLLGNFLKLPGVEREKLQLMVKICMDTRAPVSAPGTKWELQTSEKDVEWHVNFACTQLGTDYIDIIVLNRVPTDRPIEEVVASMDKIVKSGKARHIGLSEANSESIRRASNVAKIYCIEQEWSLWTRDIEDVGILDACKELGIKIVAYSPLGRGFLTSHFQQQRSANDSRASTFPRFKQGNIEKNLELVDKLKAIADRKGVSVTKLSLVWLYFQGERNGLDIIPIPGTSKKANFDENLSAITIDITDEDFNEINSIFTPDAVAGDRYLHMNSTFKNNPSKN